MFISKIYYINITKKMDKISNNKVMVQIGTNDGNDQFHDLVKKYTPSKVILIEPNSQLISKIQKKYENIPNVIIVNKAINTTDANVTLYIPAKNKVLGNSGENGITYNDYHFSIVPMNDWGSKENMIELKSESITFSQLCKNYNITDINYLQIDTEGFDAEIINDIDLNQINVDIIRYEKWNFDEQCFTRHQIPDQYSNYGINGMKNIEIKLKKYGYILSEINEIDNNDIVAYKL